MALSRTRVASLIDIRVASTSTSYYHVRLSLSTVVQHFYHRPSPWCVVLKAMRCRHLGPRLFRNQLPPNRASSRNPSSASSKRKLGHLQQGFLPYQASLSCRLAHLLAPVRSIQRHRVLSCLPHLLKMDLTRRTVCLLQSRPVRWSMLMMRQKKARPHWRRVPREKYGPAPNLCGRQ